MRIVILAFLMIAVGCAADSEENDPDAVSHGLTATLDEAAAFGDPFLLEWEPSVDYLDPLELEPVNEADTGPAPALFVRLVRGNLRPDEDARFARDYSGTISIDHGSIFVESTVMMDAGDLPGRTSQAIVNVKSFVQTRYDGLVLRVVPDLIAVENFLHVDLGPFQKTIPLGVLMSGFVEATDLTFGDNAMIASQFGHRDEVGFYAGVFSNRLFMEGGVFRGIWEAADGRILGHERVRYIPERMGFGTLRGKIIDWDGGFAGFLNGDYFPIDENRRHGAMEMNWTTDSGLLVATFDGAFVRTSLGEGFAMGIYSPAAIEPL
ncbi:hypothetical protein K8I61_01560 [bacterium]|nr:hypothetical protein [bacterium]